MTGTELFSYVMFAIGTAYVLGLGLVAYLSLRYNLPMLGAPPPKQPNIDDYRLPRKPVPPIA